MDKNSGKSTEKSPYYPKEIYVNYMNIKQLEYKLISTCLKECLDIEQSIFSEQEKECLHTCNQNIKSFFKISAKNYEASQQILNSKILTENTKRISTTDSV